MSRSIHILIVLLSGLMQGMKAHAQYIPFTNTSCGEAMAICSSTTVVDYAWAEGCLWFSFCQSPGVEVSIRVTERTSPDGPPQDVEARLWNRSACRSGLACDSLGSLGELPMTVPAAGGERFYLISVLPSGLAYNNRFTITIDGFEPTEKCCGRTPVAGFDDCEKCLGSLSPLPGHSYSIDAWVSKEDLPAGTLRIEGPYIRVECPAGNELGTWTTPPPPPLPLDDHITPVPVIDGWQLIHGEFEIPLEDPDHPGEGLDVEDFVIFLGCEGTGAAYFDDVRIQPKDAGMISYVYDPFTLRLMAELDERHFATRYEYDGEGKLVRVKKETERGVMTIQETRYNSAKTPAP